MPTADPNGVDHAKLTQQWERISSLLGRWQLAEQAIWRFLLPFGLVAWPVKRLVESAGTISYESLAWSIAIPAASCLIAGLMCNSLYALRILYSLKGIPLTAETEAYSGVIRSLAETVSRHRFVCRAVSQILGTPWPVPHIQNTGHSSR